MPAPDRTNDVPPPERGHYRECKCGKLMIPRADFDNMHQGYATWHWWCGCGEVADGGKWHPPTPEEGLTRTWELVNEQAAARANAQPGRVIPLDCTHERKTVKDGGWVCDDCGRHGTIASIGDHMRAMPPEWRRHWELASAEDKGKLAFWGFTQDQWVAWCVANPTATELLADVETAHTTHPDADGEKLVAEVMAVHPGMENADALRALIYAHVTTHGRQETVATHS